MKIAVSLVGISHTDEASAKLHDARGRIARFRAYDCCPENITRMLINPWRERGHEVDVHFTTYGHQHMDDLVQMYNPKTVAMLNFQSSGMQHTYAASLRRLDGQGYDLVISTRFDILFSQTMDETCFDLGKMNVLFREKGKEHRHHTCDNFYVFPSKHLLPFAESIERMYASGEQDGLHGAIHAFGCNVGHEHVHVVDPNDQLGHHNSFYYLPHAQD